MSLACLSFFLFSISVLDILMLVLDLGEWSVLGMMLNCIWWWGSIFEDLVKYTFIAITL